MPNLLCAPPAARQDMGIRVYLALRRDGTKQVAFESIPEPGIAVDGTLFHVAAYLKRRVRFLVGRACRSKTRDTAIQLAELALISYLAPWVLLALRAQTARKHLIAVVDGVERDTCKEDRSKHKTNSDTEERFGRADSSQWMAAGLTVLAHLGSASTQVRWMQ